MTGRSYDVYEVKVPHTYDYIEDWAVALPTG